MSVSDKCVTHTFVIILINLQIYTLMTDKVNFIIISYIYNIIIYKIYFILLMKLFSLYKNITSKA